MGRKVVGSQQGAGGQAGWVVWTSEARRLVIPRLGTEVPRSQSLDAPADVAAAFRAVGSEWKKHRALWIAGMAQMEPRTHALLERAIPWLDARKPPELPADPEQLGVVLAMHWGSLTGGESVAKPLVDAIAHYAGPAVALAALIHGHLRHLTLDTSYYVAAQTRAAWLRPYAWPVQLVDAEYYELGVWLLLRRRLAECSPEVRRATRASAGALWELAATTSPDAVPYTRESLRAALAFACDDDAWARELVPTAMKSWSEHGSALGALEVTGFALLASLTHEPTAREVVLKSLKQGVAPRFLQVYVETLVDRHEHRAAKMLTAIVRACGWKPRTQGYDVVLIRTVKALCLIQHPDVVAFFDEEREGWSKSRAKATVAKYLKQMGAA